MSFVVGLDAYVGKVSRILSLQGKFISRDEKEICRSDSMLETILNDRLSKFYRQILANQKRPSFLGLFLYILFNCLFI